MQAWEVAVRSRGSFIWSLAHLMTASFPDERCKVLLDRVAAETAPVSAGPLDFDTFTARVYVDVSRWVAERRRDLAPLLPAAPPRDALDLVFASLSAQVDEWYAGVGGTVAPVTMKLEEAVDLRGGHFVGGSFGRTKRIVRLLVDPVRFDWRSMVGVSVVLMHELVCHAGAGSDSAGRQVFSEALMDPASVAFVSRWASKEQLPVGFSNQLGDIAASLQAARRAAGVYKSGRFARGTLLRLVESAPRRAGRQTDILVDRLLLGVNAHPAPIERKDDLAEQLAENTLPPPVSALLVDAALATTARRSQLIDRLLG